MPVRALRRADLIDGQGREVGQNPINARKGITTEGLILPYQLATLRQNPINARKGITTTRYGFRQDASGNGQNPINARKGITTHQ